MSTIAVFRVDSSGRIVAGNACGEGLARRVGSGACARVVNACALDGSPICNAECAKKLAAADDAGHHSITTVIAGELAQLSCYRVGDEAIVVVELTGREAPTRRDMLTPRELEVLALVARGLSSQEIAEQLGVARSTVRTHVEHLCRRLGVRTRAQAVARATISGQLVRDELPK